MTQLTQQRSDLGYWALVAKIEADRQAAATAAANPFATTAASAGNSTADYLEELAATLASHGSNLAALRREALEQKVSPYLAAPGVPSSPGSVSGDSALAGLGSAYSTSVAMGAAGLFITDGALTVTNPGSTVIIDGTSNMFKIVATGTLTCAWPNSSASVTGQVQLTDLAPGGVIPSVFGFLALYSGNVRGVGYASHQTSGELNHLAQYYCQFTGDDLLINLNLVTALTGAGLYGQTGSLRYHVLKEAGI